MVDELARKIPEPGGGDAGDFFSVPPSALDLNDHVTTLRYPRWVLDAYPLPFLDTHSLREMEMHFLNEGLAGDRLRVITADTQEEEPGKTGRLHAVRREGDDVDLVRARLVWGPRDEDPIT